MQTAMRQRMVKREKGGNLQALDASARQPGRSQQNPSRMKTDVPDGNGEWITWYRNDTPSGVGDLAEEQSIFTVTRRDIDEEMPIGEIADRGDSAPSVNAEYPLGFCFAKPQITRPIRLEDMETWAHRRTPVVSSTAKRRRENAEILRRASRAPEKASAPNRQVVSESDDSIANGDRIPFYEEKSRGAQLGDIRAAKRAPGKERGNLAARPSSTTRTGGLPTIGPIRYPTGPKANDKGHMIQAGSRAEEAPGVGVGKSVADFRPD